MRRTRMLVNGGVVGLCLLLMIAGRGRAQQNIDWDAVQITPHHVAGSVHYLEGQGGNVGMILTVADRVERLVSEGRSLEEVTAANPTAEFNATWGDPGRFLGALYQQLGGTT